MAEAVVVAAGAGPKVTYIIVTDEEKAERGKESFRYTRGVLQSSLQLMGCKARHAFKISQRVFRVTRSEPLSNTLLPNDPEVMGIDCSKGPAENESTFSTANNLGKVEMASVLVSEEDDRSKSLPFELYKRRTTLIVRREIFQRVVCDALTEYKYVGPNQKADLVLACRIRERKESVTVLLCGTSGCGKSTLSALLGSRLGITTVVSTDSIRHMMRSFVDEKENPLLWASTYHAGEHLDPVAVAEAKARRKAKKLSGISNPHCRYCKGKSDNLESKAGPGTSEFISPRQMAVEGYKAQSEMVIDSLDRLITAWEERKESVIVEGVHLSLNFVMGLMKRHPSIVPFLVYISNEEKHMERFAVRAKYMTLDPAKNKYVKYIRNIRTIQDYLCKRADKHLVPKINNTNVDKSVAAIHATVFSCLRRRQAGDQLYDPTTNTVAIVDEEYRNQCAANSLSSKGMFQLIQQKGSSRHLALLNIDGSVAKTWPVNLVDSNGMPELDDGSENGIGTPTYGTLQIGKAEPVNLQFGHFGISAWPSEGGTSHAGSFAGSFDESKADLTDNGSKYYSSGCSSPRLSDGHAKELKEEQSVHGSDEEADDQPEIDSDDDFTDDKHDHEEMGSVDEESTKTDEEYDDLAMLDTEDNGYWSDDEEIKDRLQQNGSVAHESLVEGDKYKQNLDRFLRSRSERFGDPLRSYFSMLVEKGERRMSNSGSIKTRKRSLSIPAIGKHGSAIDDPILSGAQLR